MAIKTKSGKWQCSYCLKEYPDSAKANACREEHDLVYVALSREDLNRLVNYLFIPDAKLITESLTRTLQVALRNSRKTIDKSS